MLLGAPLLLAISFKRGAQRRGPMTSVANPALCVYASDRLDRLIQFTSDGCQAGKNLIAFRRQTHCNGGRAASIGDVRSVNQKRRDVFAGENEGQQMYKRVTARGRWTQRNF